MEESEAWPLPFLGRETAGAWLDALHVGFESVLGKGRVAFFLFSGLFLFQYHGAFAGRFWMLLGHQPVLVHKCNFKRRVTIDRSQSLSLCC